MHETNKNKPKTNNVIPIKSDFFAALVTEIYDVC